MLTMILLTGDTKLAQQIELWVRQFMGERLRVESFKGLAEYKAMLETKEEAKAAGAPPAEPKQIRLFVVDLELIQQKPSIWIADLQRMTTELGRPHLIEGAAPKVLMMGFQGGSYRPETLQHDSIDDLILKPIDRTLFLQKVEFLISDDAKLSPSFLFRAKSSEIVEVGRDVVLDEISEFAVSVRSPGPVPEGSFAAIHADVFGAKGARRIIGRVYESVRHPVREGEYVVRFSYFGVTPDQLSTIRRFIKANQTQVRSKTWGPPTAGGASGAAAAAAAAAKPGLSKELQEKMALLKMRKFAVIELNPEALSEAKSTLETAFKGITVRTFPSYSRLTAELQKLLPETAKKAVPKPPPPANKDGAVPLDQAFPGGKKITVIVRGKTHELVRYETPVKKTDIVLGYESSTWTERPDLFAKAVEKDDLEVFEEFMILVESGTAGRSHFRMTDAHGRSIMIEASGTLEKAGGADGGALLRLELGELDQEGWEKALSASTGGTAPSKDPSSYRFEAILIDGACLRPDPTAWYEKFVELLRATKVLGPEDQPPKIFVLSDPKARTRLEDFRIKGVTDFSFKPLDRRFTVQKFHAVFNTLLLTREPEAPPFIPCEIPAKLGKEVVMDEVSEFGLSILHPTAFREKSFMRFFSRLFGDDGEWVSGKCHFCEKSGEGETMRCRFMFFGPAEDLTQRIRRWIREDYVAKKEGKG